MEAPKSSFDFNGLLQETLQQAKAGKIAIADLAEDGPTIAKYSAGTVKQPRATVKEDLSLLTRVTKEFELLETSWSKLDGGGKGNVILWLVGTALGGLFTIEAAKNIRPRDTDGQPHTNWSQVLVTLLQGALACGSLGMAVHAVHSGSVGR